MATLIPPDRERHRRACPAPESLLVSQAFASMISGIPPATIYGLTYADPYPGVGDSPVIRSARVRSQTLVRLDDVLLIAQAVADERQA
jgi:hypothetical protein